MPKKKRVRKTSNRNATKNRRQKNDPERIQLYHDMAVYENFERCAQRIFTILRDSQQASPGAERTLLLRIQGHRNNEGGYDHDAYEILCHFLPEFIFPYLTAAITPFGELQNKNAQRNDIPNRLYIGYPAGEEKDFWYDVDLLPIRAREQTEGNRKTPPSKEVIARYLGMESDPCCLVCWNTPTERAHVVPSSLGGSMDVRNFALLCEYHHRQAPDIADAEAFWAWVDYAEMRDSGSKWERETEHVKELARKLGSRTEKVNRSEVDFIAAVRFELEHLYGWEEVDFARFSWGLQEEYHRVLETATRKHFGIERKVSTHSWAYDVALYRITRDHEARKRRRNKVLLYDSIPDCQRRPCNFRIDSVPPPS
ncbi:HNH endonuclease signature motif containing protein [Actinomadura sp. NPDC000929]|uniref:HNH endonuclease signature motif containing protein n=1 Tax=Actinomadura sp. NPDC000929 TaxID=3154517 RepID=UPI003391E60C